LERCLALLDQDINTKKGCLIEQALYLVDAFCPILPLLLDKCPNYGDKVLASLKTILQHFVNKDMALNKSEQLQSLFCLLGDIFKDVPNLGIVIFDDVVLCLLKTWDQIKATRAVLNNAIWMIGLMIRTMANEQMHYLSQMTSWIFQTFLSGSTTPTIMENCLCGISAIATQDVTLLPDVSTFFSRYILWFRNMSGSSEEKQQCFQGMCTILRSHPSINESLLTVILPSFIEAAAYPMCSDYDGITEEVQRLLKDLRSRYFAEKDDQWLLICGQVGTAAAQYLLNNN